MSWQPPLAVRVIDTLQRTRDGMATYQLARKLNARRETISTMLSTFLREGAPIQKIGTHGPGVVWKWHGRTLADDIAEFGAVFDRIPK